MLKSDLEICTFQIAQYFCILLLRSNDAAGGKSQVYLFFCCVTKQSSISQPSRGEEPLQSIRTILMTS